MTPTPDPIKTILNDAMYKAANLYPVASEMYDRTLDEATQAINNELLRARIDTYQRLMLWLQDQDDNEALVRLAKDIDVELDKLFAQLMSTMLGVRHNRSLTS